MNRKVLTGLAIVSFFSGTVFSDPTQNPLINHQPAPVVIPTPAPLNPINVGNDTNGSMTGNGVNTNGTANKPHEMHKVTGTEINSAPGN
jgi:hypothetical protein